MHLVRLECVGFDRMRDEGAQAPMRTQNYRKSHRKYENLKSQMKYIHAITQQFFPLRKFPLLSLPFLPLHISFLLSVDNNSVSFH